MMIDMEVMHHVFGKNHAAIVEYLESFVKITSELIKKTDCMIQDKNKIEAMNIIHKLKGPAGSIGFKKIDKLCEKAEKELAHSNWRAAHLVCLDMENILKHFQIELQKNFK